MKPIVIAMLTLSPGLGACASHGTGERLEPRTCSARAANMLVGQVAPDDATLLRKVGGSIVRRIAPGDPTTKDYRVERVTVTIAGGQVVSASCG